MSLNGSYYKTNTSEHKGPEMGSDWVWPKATGKKAGLWWPPRTLGQEVALVISTYVSIL